jgi:hypothetical protein
MGDPARYPDRVTWRAVFPYTPCALNFTVSWGVRFPCAPSQKIPKTSLWSKLASLELKEDDASPQAKSSVVPNNSQEAGGESTTSKEVVRIS